MHLHMIFCSEKQTAKQLSRQETPLHMAARSGNVQVAQLLVSHGAEVNALNLDDLTPLVIAAQEGKEAGTLLSPGPRRLQNR